MSKTVTLSHRYEIGSSLFEKLSFREPKLSDYRRHGKVVESQRGVVVTYPDAIWAYADTLLKDVPHGALSELELEDALAIEETIIGFFISANDALRKRESLSSGSVGDQSTSTN